MLKQILRFGAVGGVGFIVDASMLWLLLRLGLNPFTARALSFPVAVFVTWILNRTWTFAVDPDASKTRELNRYVAVQLTGAAANYCAYSIVISHFAHTGRVIFIALVFGSFVGMFINFWGARQFAFRATKSDKAE